ncbi:GTPase-activating protein, partial [Deinococcus sp. MIMF12]|nr:GTPase-activating protein [Deinococcus rhizophilus]
EAAAAAERGQLSPTGRYAWFSLRLLAGTRRTGTSAIADALDGERTLGELLALGHSVEDLRAYLLAEVRAGLRFPGTGWVLRDLIWEGQHPG